MTASNLGEYAAQDLDEMERAALRLPETVRLAVLLDRTAGSNDFTTGQGQQPPWTDTGRAIIVPDVQPGVDTTFERIGERNTGSAAALGEFFAWATTAAPARRYALVLWDHGNGLLGMNFDSDGDGTGVNPPDRLEVSELTSALRTADEDLGVRVDLVAFDECAMAMAEIAQALADRTDVIVASQEAIPGAGFDYETALATLENDPAGVTAAAIAAGMVASYQNAVPTTSSARPQITRNTLSVVETSALSGLLNALGGFASTVLDVADTFVEEQWAILREARDEAVSFFGQDDYRDLGQFMALVADAPELCSKDGQCGQLPDKIPMAADAVVAALGAAVIDQTTTDLAATGLSIFFPRPGSQRPGAFPRPVLSIGDYRTKYAAFQTTRWGEFLDEFVQHEPEKGKSGADLLEPNGNAAQASDMARVSSTASLSVHRTNDRDWFRFTLGGTGTTENFVSASISTTSTGIQLSVYDSAAANNNAPLRRHQHDRTARVDLSGLPAGTIAAAIDELLARGRLRRDSLMAETRHQECE